MLFNKSTLLPQNVVQKKATSGTKTRPSANPTQLNSFQNSEISHLPNEIIPNSTLYNSKTIQGKFNHTIKQFKNSHSNVPIQRASAPINKTGLPENIQTGVEQLSGISLRDVKVHYNSNKPAQLQAHAYAQGTDIHLGPGQDKHLPHEAWHVVQQKQGRVQATTQLKGLGNAVNDDNGLEAEADLMGAKSVAQFKKDQPIIQANSMSEQKTPLIKEGFVKDKIAFFESANPVGTAKAKEAKKASRSIAKQTEEKIAPSVDSKTDKEPVAKEKAQEVISKELTDSSAEKKIALETAKKASRLATAAPFSRVGAGKFASKVPKDKSASEKVAKEKAEIINKAAKEKESKEKEAKDKAAKEKEAKDKAAKESHLEDVQKEIHSSDTNYQKHTAVEFGSDIVEQGNIVGEAAFTQLEEYLKLKEEKGNDVSTEEAEYITEKAEMGVGFAGLDLLVGVIEIAPIIKKWHQGKKLNFNDYLILTKGFLNLGQGGAVLAQAAIVMMSQGGEIAKEAISASIANSGMGIAISVIDSFLAFKEIYEAGIIEKVLKDVQQDTPLYLAIQAKITEKKGKHQLARILKNAIGITASALAIAAATGAISLFVASPVGWALMGAGFVFMMANLIIRYRNKAQKKYDIVYNGHDSKMKIKQKENELLEKKSKKNQFLKMFSKSDSGIRNQAIDETLKEEGKTVNKEYAIAIDALANTLVSRSKDSNDKKIESQLGTLGVTLKQLNLINTDLDKCKLVRKVLEK